MNFSEINRSENESKSKENLSLWGLKREEILKSEEIIYQAGLKSDEITFQAGVFIIHFFREINFINFFVKLISRKILFSEHHFVLSCPVYNQYTLQKLDVL